MRNYLIKRILMMIPMLFGITLISYLIIDMAPGDAASMFIDPATIAKNPNIIEEVREKLGLNEPGYVRYFKWLKTVVLEGNFGYSYLTGRPVMEEISSRLGITVLLSSITMVLETVLGLAIGVFCARHQYQVIDYIITFLTFVWISMPAFWFALLMIMLFTTTLGWLPSIGLTTNGMVYTSFWQELWDRVSHLIMPITTMVLCGMGGWARIERSMYLEVMNQDYIRTARSKGLSERTISVRHAFKNASIPIITNLAGVLPGLISGAFVIENVFSIPGLGKLGTNATMGRDYPVTMAVLFFGSLLVMIGLFLIDILYAVVDPRIRYQ